jgi:putative membrane protein
MILTTAETNAIEARVAEVEARTGAQVVAAVAGKSNTYPQLPWKAFALGAAVAGFGVVLADWLRPDWTIGYAALLHAVAILGAGAAFALLVVFVPAFARLFLRPPRRDLEVRRHAESLFLKRELFGTRERNGVLLLVSLFERRVEILPDVGFRERVSATEWHHTIARMMPLLRAGRPAEAVQEGLAVIEALLVAKGFSAQPGARNELPDRPIVERGP